MDAKKTYLTLVLIFLLSTYLAYAIVVPPKLSVTVDKTIVKTGATITLTATSSSTTGISKMKLGHGTNYDEKTCGINNCSKTWTVTSSNPGQTVYSLWSYDTAGPVSKKTIIVNYVECLNGETQTQVCGTSDIGECSFGTQTKTCTNNAWPQSWGSCAGNIEPITESCDNKDNDCDNQVDDGDVCAPICTDNDNDGFSTQGGACGAVDCNDNNDNINPNALEICDYIDNDCSGVVDNGLIVSCSSNVGCDDSDIHTIDSCNNAGSCFSTCQNTFTNNAPMMPFIADYNITENENVAFSFLSEDSDMDQITLSATGLPANADFTDNSNGAGNFDWTPDTNQAGTYTITFTAKDSFNASSSRTIRITVNDICIENWVVNEACQNTDQTLRTYTDSNDCGTIFNRPQDHNTYSGTCDYCTPSWNEMNGTCQVTDIITSTFTDSNNCYASTGLPSDNIVPPNNIYACDYCTPDWTATLWEACLADDTQNHDYFDSNNCFTTTGLSSDMAGYPGIQSQSCDYCTPSWQVTGQGACQINDTQEVLYSDILDCFSQTGLSSDDNSPSSTQPCDYCTPNPTNTSWGEWVNITSCLSNNTYNQQSTKTSYDANGCYAQTGLESDIYTDITYNQYQSQECDYCTPSIANTTWTSWADITACRINDTKVQQRSLTQYDSNYCQEVVNQTITEEQEAICDYCIPSAATSDWTLWSDVGCSLDQMNQTRTQTTYDANGCYEATGLTSDFFNTIVASQSQLVGPAYFNTTWTSWINSGSCLSDDTQLQTRSMTQYDTYACAPNNTITETRYLSCDYCIPSWELNTTWSACLSNETQSRNYYDANNCYASTGLSSDLLGKPADEMQSCSYDNDADGFSEDQGDCNDANSLINPSATESCNGLDDNCDASTDNGMTAPLAAKQAGVCAGATMTCAGVSGWVEPNYALIIDYELTETSCDLKDNDCDATADEGLKTTFYQDFDTDTYGNLTSTTLACSVPIGYSANSNDCNDNNNLINPGAIEIVDNVDQNCVNDAPVANISTVNTTEDTSAAVSLLCSDADGNPLTYIILTSPSKGTLSGSGASRIYMPSANIYGNDSFTFRCNDGSLNSNSATVFISINAVNDAPVMSAIANKTINEIERLTFLISATDVEGDALIYSATGLPSGATFNSGTRNFSWTPDYTQEGIYAVTFTVSDGYAQDSETIIITVNDVCVENWTADNNMCQADDLKIISYTDSNACGTIINLPINNGTLATCDFCLPNWTLNTTWTACQSNIQFQNYYDANNCYASTNLSSDLLGKPSDINQTCDYDIDNDGVNYTDDCNDNNASVWQSMTGYQDFDADTWTVNDGLVFCTDGTLPTGYVLASNPIDCNDNNSTINPSAIEISNNGVDEDCSGVDLITAGNLQITILSPASENRTSAKLWNISVSVNDTADSCYYEFGQREDLWFEEPIYYSITSTGALDKNGTTFSKSNVNPSADHNYLRVFCNNTAGQSFNNSIHLEIDTVKPGQVDDLKVLWHDIPSYMNLSFTMPGDNGFDAEPRIRSIDIRWSKNPITSSNFNNASILLQNHQIGCYYPYEGEEQVVCEVLNPPCNATWSNFTSGQFFDANNNLIEPAYACEAYKDANGTWIKPTFYYAMRFQDSTGLISNVSNTAANHTPVYDCSIENVIFKKKNSTAPFESNLSKAGYETLYNYDEILLNLTVKNIGDVSGCEYSITGDNILGATSQHLDLTPNQTQSFSYNWTVMTGSVANYKSTIQAAGNDGTDMTTNNGLYQFDLYGMNVSKYVYLGTMAPQGNTIRFLLYDNTTFADDRVSLRWMPVSIYHQKELGASDPVYTSINTYTVTPGLPSEFYNYTCTSPFTNCLKPYVFRQGNGEFDWNISNLEQNAIYQFWMTAGIYYQETVSTSQITVVG